MKLANERVAGRSVPVTKELEIITEEMKTLKFNFDYL